MASQKVNVFIDDSAISVLVTQGRVPQKWATVPLEPGLVKEGVVQDQNAVAAKLKEIWRNSRIVRRRVTLGISGVNCLYQLLLLPELPENLRGEAITREASQSLGIPLEGVYLSWQILTVEHGQMRVFLAVMPRDKVDSLVATLRLADLKPTVMDIKPLCLARTSDEPRAIMVDTRQDAFDIVVLGDGVPEVIRSLYVAPETPAGERTALLRSELERSIAFYNAAHMDNPIDLTVPVLVSGDLSRDEGERTSLAGPRERPVRDIVSPLTEKEGFAPLQYMTCVGLALKDILVEESGAVSYSVVNFNALPDVYQVKKRPLSEVLWLPTVLVGVVVIGMGIWGITYLSGQNADLADELDQTSLRAEEQEVRPQDIAALTAEVNSVEAPQTALNSQLTGLQQNRDAFAERLKVVSVAASASGVELRQVDLTEKEEVLKVTASGLVDTEAKIFEFVRRLEDSGLFSSVVVDSINVEEDGITFSVMLS